VNITRLFRDNKQTKFPFLERRSALLMPCSLSALWVLCSRLKTWVWI